MGIHISYAFPVQSGAEELLRVSQPNDSYIILGIRIIQQGHPYNQPVQMIVGGMYFGYILSFSTKDPVPVQAPQHFGEDHVPG